MMEQVHVLFVAVSSVIFFVQLTSFKFSFTCHALILVFGFPQTIPHENCAPHHCLYMNTLIHQVNRDAPVVSGLPPLFFFSFVARKIYLYRLLKQRQRCASVRNQVVVVSLSVVGRTGRASVSVRGFPGAAGTRSRALDRSGG